MDFFRETGFIFRKKIRWCTGHGRPSLPPLLPQLGTGIGRPLSSDRNHAPSLGSGIQDAGIHELQELLVFSHGAW
jgi:hypothetical protein